MRSFLPLALFFFLCCSVNGQHPAPGQPVHKDLPYQQKFSIKYVLNYGASPGSDKGDSVRLQKVYCDRNGAVQVCSSAGLLKPSDGALLYPGELVPDLLYRPMRNMKIKDMILYNDQFVYADEKAVLSNAWAGKLYAKHRMPAVQSFCGGPDFSFLLSDGNNLQYLKDSNVVWEAHSDDRVIDILYDRAGNSFWILGGHSISNLSLKDMKLSVKYKGDGLTCFALSDNQKEIITGTHNGYFNIRADDGVMTGEIQTKLPCNDLSVIRVIDGKTWFGSEQGAFMLRADGKFDYYASARWIPSDRIVDIAKGGKDMVLLLTDKGLGEIHFQSMTLYDKAVFFEKQVRTRHIRNGFNATISGMKGGNPDTGVLEDSDNDGLWTAMYLGGEVFRYAVTHSPDALQNCRESLDAMERMYTMTHIKGFPARSFERRGYESSDREVWRPAADSGWDWKSTTSSDEAIGHMFVFGAIAELVDDPGVKNKAIRLMDALMQHIVDHQMYMVDWDGKPTKWGRWNPEYVNARPLMVGDRKITSSNIVSMLQTAWHFTHKEIYKDKAFELMQKYGYLKNLMRPMKDIGRAPEDADELSRDLSDGWNHSDDEMYFLGYWGLYRYAFNDTLKAKFKEAILDHWQAERPEKEAAWDLFTAITGVQSFDLQNAVDYLQRYPLDLVNWRIKNSQRKDLDFIAPNFRRQTITEVLPPDELPIERHNANLFGLDGGNNGRSENSAGDIWLLPYWLGRYLGVISAPAEHKISK
ncbi:MAG: hypothetical protein Q8918_09290 [Bacteroidota bacterium]|nr:hypothetical protein [Bacteroidota bacterium]